jgi:hypothetical protein
MLQKNKPNSEELIRPHKRQCKTGLSELDPPLHLPAATKPTGVFGTGSRYSKLALEVVDKSTKDHMEGSLVEVRRPRRESFSTHTKTPLHLVRSHVSPVRSAQKYPPLQLTKVESSKAQEEQTWLERVLSNKARVPYENVSQESLLHLPPSPKHLAKKSEIAPPHEREVAELLIALSSPKTENHFKAIVKAKDDKKRPRSPGI